MEVTFTIVPPDGKVIADDLVPRLNEALLRMQVAFIFEDASGEHAVLKLIDTSHSEQRLVIRLLQRAGYNIELDLPDS